MNAETLSKEIVLELRLIRELVEGLIVFAESKSLDLSELQQIKSELVKFHSEAVRREIQSIAKPGSPQLKWPV